MPSTKVPAFTPSPIVVPLEKRPERELFTLPDLTPILVEEDKKGGKIVISLGSKPICSQEVVPASTGANAPNGSSSTRNELLQKARLDPAVHFTLLEGRKSRVSLHGAVNADRAESLGVWRVDHAAGKDASISCGDFWAILYGFWIRRDEHERVPVEIGSFVNRDDLKRFVIHTGLGFRAPDASNDSEFLLQRAAFWQGAGAPLGRSWLQSPVLGPGEFGTLTCNSFPNLLSFTSSQKPPVLTTHPLRPPKPEPGALLYSRYIHSVGSHLTLTHIDANNPSHFEPYCRWQNSDRVKHGWRESGDEEHHRRYLADRLQDPHIMGYVVAWDGDLAGYGEASWNKEDGMAAFVGGVGDYDQGTHLLCGEERFRGRFRFGQSMISMKHFCFLREPRTQVVFGEPRADLDIVELLKMYLPQNVRREVDLPHKRAVLFELHRDRFFTDAVFY